MILRQLTIRHFRGIVDGNIQLDGHAVLIGGNSVGKSTICEAIDLLMGPDRIHRPSAIDEHDFTGRRYVDEHGEPIVIEIEGVLTGMTPDIERQYRGHLEHWDTTQKILLDERASPEDLGKEAVVPALRVCFRGRYDEEEDEFRADTFFASPPAEDEEKQARFGRRDKRKFGYLYLRALRTGTRALSLERGSLLDLILRLKGEERTQMWEQTLAALESIDPPIHNIDQLKEVLDDIDRRVRQFVGLSSSERALGLFPSQLTREHLRRTVTLFGASERSGELVPYWRLGSGVVNAMVFALLTFIAELKQNVIFAMEEPELAIPPHTQRRIVQFLRGSMEQVILTTHSPFILEQFPAEAVVIIDRGAEGQLVARPVELSGLKAKSYRGGLRRQFAEAMLGRGVICVEGISDDGVLHAASAVLEKGASEESPYTPLDLSGVTVVPADGSGNLLKLGKFFNGIGLRTYAICDQENNDAKIEELRGAFDEMWVLEYKGIEALLAETLSIEAQRAFLLSAQESTEFPHDQVAYSSEMGEEAVRKALLDLLKCRKGYGYAARLVESVSAEGLPAPLRVALERISADLPTELDQATDEQSCDREQDPSVEPSPTGAGDEKPGLGTE